MTFEQLEELFFALKINADPSGFHGFLCGRLCCGVVGLEDLTTLSVQWLGLDEEQYDDAENALQDFFQSALVNLEDLEFLFQPVLPDDELPLPERLLAVSQWCGNFISGLGEGMGGEFEMSEEGKEALEDIAAIAQISTDLEIEEDAERDYAELVEYIRIAVQLVFADLQGTPEEQQPTIH